MTKDSWGCKLKKQDELTTGVTIKDLPPLFHMQMTFNMLDKLPVSPEFPKLKHLHRSKCWVYNIKMFMLKYFEIGPGLNIEKKAENRRFLSVFHATQATQCTQKLSYI